MFYNPKDRPTYTHNIIEPFDMVTKENENEDRIYVTPEGNEYISITTLLGYDEEKQKILENWRKRVGYEAARQKTERSAERGECVHQMAENYLNNILDYSKGFPELYHHLFKKMIPQVHKIDNILAIEQALYSDILKVAGRVDLIAEYDHTKTILDFKTSEKIKPREWIEDYFIQASAYSYMFEELYGIRIPTLTIIMTPEHGVKAEVFQEDRKNFKSKLANRIKGYYHA